MEFLGFPRSDGSVGIRNYVLVLPPGLIATNIWDMPFQFLLQSRTFQKTGSCVSLVRRRSRCMLLYPYAELPHRYSWL